MNVRAAAAETFEHDGYVALDGVFDEADLALVDDAVGSWAARQIEDWTGKAATVSDYQAAFYAAWQGAGRPAFRRSPLRNLTHPAFFGFLRSPAMLRIAAELLETDEISVHGIFNARPMLPSAPATPWHLDAQYWRVHGDPEPQRALTRRVLTIWIPLQDLEPELGGLEVATLAATGRRLYDDSYVDAPTSIIALPPNATTDLHGAVPLVARGGCICFSQLNAHRGTPNRADRIRWTIDVRYEATDGATMAGRRFGFIAASPSGRHRETAFEEWRDRCLATPPPF